MKLNKSAFFTASWLIIGIAALPGFSLAAEPAKKPAASQPVAKPEAHDMSTHDMSTHDMAPGEGQTDESACCGQMGGMKCGQMGGMMCEHKGAMMGGQMEGKMCDHKGGMGGPMGGMMERHGPGMMMGPSRMHMVMSLDLSDEQRSKINKLHDELKHNNWATEGLIMDESAKLRDLYAADKRNAAEIGKVYQKIFDLQRKTIEATITTENRIEELLTPEQRTQLNNMRHKAGPAHEHPMH